MTLQAAGKDMLFHMTINYTGAGFTDLERVNESTIFDELEGAHSH